MIDEADDVQAAAMRMRREKRDFRRDRTEDGGRKPPAPPRFPAGGQDGRSVRRGIATPGSANSPRSTWAAGGWPWIALAAIVLGVLNWRLRRMGKKDKP